MVSYGVVLYYIVLYDIFVTKFSLKMAFIPEICRSTFTKYK